MESALGLLTVAIGCAVYRLVFESYQSRHPDPSDD
jgi:hypothetical protein